MKKTEFLTNKETIGEVYQAKKYLLSAINVFFILIFIPSIVYNFILAGAYIYLGIFEILLIGASVYALYYIRFRKELEVPAYIASFVMFGVSIALLLTARGEAFGFGVTLVLGITVFTLLRLKEAVISYAIGSLFALFLAIFIFGTSTQTIYNVVILYSLSGGILYVFNYSQKVIVDKLVSTSRTDSLTGLWNRKKLNEELKREIAIAKRYKLPLTVMISDIDHFKRINDTYGHDAGDECLVKISNILSEMTRETDVLARWGGEEFLYLFPNTTINAAQIIAKKIISKLNELEYKDLGPITMSMGLTSYIENEDSNEMFNRADKALFISKNEGRNKFTVM